MKVAFLAAAMLAAASALFYFSAALNGAGASGDGTIGRQSAGQRSPARTSAAHALPTLPLPTLPHKSLSASLPLFFEPNHGQTDPQVKFLARGAGYGLFLTAGEAVLNLQRVSPAPRTASAPQPALSSVIRMKLDGANAAAISGAALLPGKSSYFIGNDASQWHRDIPHFARVQYQSVYHGVDLVYYGDQGQLEYDFRVAPGADPSQIAISFQGASTRIDSGDLVLSTANGDVRFHAPRVYQPATSPDAPGKSGNSEKTVTGSFRQVAGGKIGFTIADYDHSRELVIDPVLSYSTYLGGSGAESLVKLAVDANQTIYVAGSTTSTNFPVTNSSTLNNPQAQNIFISQIAPQNAGTGNSQLLYSIYLGGSQTDSLAGIAVDQSFNIYIAGTTTSNSDFPTTSNGLNPGPVSVGAHGFVSTLTNNSGVYSLTYSTYLAGNGTDTVTGLAVDVNKNAYVTGVTTSTNTESASAPFPANPLAFQPASNSPGLPQFFASEIDTAAGGLSSMVYSTYFGGGNYAGAMTVAGGGIAVDTGSGNGTVNMYITGTTNMLPGQAGSSPAPFPIRDAQQACLDEASKTVCTLTGPTNPDAFVAKFSPSSKTPNDASLIYSTYVGGSGSETGVAIAVDTTTNAYITGSTNSTDWLSPVNGFQSQFGGGNEDAFIAKIGTLSGSIYPLNYFTYLGGTGDDIGQDIVVDASQAVHVTGSTSSVDFPVTTSAFQATNAGGEDAFAALISTTLTGQGIGDFSTYLGGANQDQATGVAIDLFGATYVAGTTQSPFPVTATAFQPTFGGGATDAFVSKIGASSALTVTAPPNNTSPTPNPLPRGTQAAFTFDITNNGPDAASQVFFTAIVPGTGLASPPIAKVTSGQGSCGTVQGQGTLITCFIPALTVCPSPCTTSQASVEVDATPIITGTSSFVQVSGSATANNNGVVYGPISQMDPIVDFTITATPQAQTVTNGGLAQFLIAFTPTGGNYNATITPTQTTLPSMVTAPSPTFNPTSVVLSGTGQGTTTLSIQTVARPVTTGSLLRRGSFYATWLPIGGLSLAGLGIGAGRKRRRWLVGLVLLMIAGTILLQPGCGSSSTTTPGGGTQAGIYTITITGTSSSSTTAAHTYPVTLTVD